MARGWRLGSCWCCCALLACLALGQGQKCSPTQYEQDGLCCNKCLPGYKVRIDCAGEAETICDPCEPHHFQGDWTQEKHCTPHRDCDDNAGLVVKTPGDATQNVVCRCRDGTHCSSHECQTCRVNKPCGPGEGVQQEASGAKDTVCVACAPGSFSNSSSPTARCQPWSSCEARQLVQKAKGSSTSDVVCAGLPETPKETKRSSALPVVLASLAAVGLLGAGIGLFLWRQKQRERKNCHLNPQQRDQTDPQEVDYPVQETLPVTQEDGKDCHLPEQECL